MNELLTRTRAFALRCLKVADAMPNRTGARSIANQLARSGTSVAANYRAARRARSKAEFIAKLHITLEESDETHYWLGLAQEAGYVAPRKLEALIKEANELTAMLVSSLKTTKTPR